MAKRLILFLLPLAIYANLFDKKCLKCHQQKNISLKAIFFNYLLYHSSERRVKEAIKEYLLHPDIKKSLLPANKKFLYKHKIDLNEIDILIQIYWNRYKVFGKIR